MSADNCIIVGASHAGVSLALQLRREGWSGGIQLLSAESALPYHRPPLSKDLLAGTKTIDLILLRPEKTYADSSIELLLNCEVTAIDRTAHAVQLHDGRHLGYSRLALCTGARARTLPLAVPQQGNLFYIRSLADVSRLAPHLQAGKRAVLIGGGYIGLETAAQLSRKGIHVTLLEAADRILNRVTAPVVSDFYEALHSAHGVTIHNGVTIQAIVNKGLSSSVQTSTGVVYEADFIIVGIGIIPNTELATFAGLHTDQGIVVNEFAQTSDPHIYAAGDCTLHPSALYQRLLRLESVQNATDQARVAAANICNKPTRYDAVPWFWSDQYLAKLQTAGLHTGYDAVVVRGNPTNLSDPSFAVFYLHNGKLLAADCINRPKEFMASKQLIRSGALLDHSALADEAVDLSRLAM